MSENDAEPVRPGPATRAVAGASSHAELHQCLEEYLEALVAVRKQPRSVLFLASLLRRNLFEHMRYEEDLVLPWWKEQPADPPVNATVDCFLEDHRLLRQCLLSVQEESVRASCRSVEPQALRELLAGLDDLLEHHDQREADHLYPALEAAGEPAAVNVRDLVSAVRQVPMERARILLDGWLSRGVGDRILADYQSWAQNGPLAAEGSWGCLDESARNKAAALARRDRNLIERHRARSFVDDRSRLGEERLVEQTLRRTVVVLVDAWLDPCFP